MNIAIEDVSKNKRLSRETPCFEAVIVLDGKRVGRVRNDGGGGANVYETPKTKQRLEAYANTLPPVLLSFGVESISINQSADTLVNGLL